MTQTNVEQTTTYSPPLPEETHRHDRELYELLDALSPETPWPERKAAAQRLGDRRCPEALCGLLEALVDDPFWMVRCAIIQALERINNPEAIPTLSRVMEVDDFHIVRSYAATAVERLVRDNRQAVETYVRD